MPDQNSQGSKANPKGANVPPLKETLTTMSMAYQYDRYLGYEIF